jgi:hypothetical protein
MAAYAVMWTTNRCLKFYRVISFFNYMFFFRLLEMFRKDRTLSDTTYFLHFIIIIGQFKKKKGITQYAVMSMIHGHKQLHLYVC